MKLIFLMDFILLDTSTVMQVWKYELLQHFDVHKIFQIESNVEVNLAAHLKVLEILR